MRNITQLLSSKTFLMINELSYDFLSSPLLPMSLKYKTPDKVSRADFWGGPKYEFPKAAP